MMPPQIASQESMLLLVHVLLTVTAGILAACLLSTVFFRRQPAARHGVWLAALVLAAVIPLVVPVFRQMGWHLASIRVGVQNLPDSRREPATARLAAQARLPVSVPETHPDQPLPIRQVAAERLQSRETEERLDAEPEPGSHSQAGSRAGEPESLAASLDRGSDMSLGLVPGLLALWLAGSCYFLARLAVGWLATRKLLKQVRPIDARTLQVQLTRVSSALGVSRVPPIVISDQVHCPVVVGLLRPHIVLPEKLCRRVTPQQLTDVLIHECAHVVRRDPWVRFHDLYRIQQRRQPPGLLG